jgi:hypothetical protein
MIPMNTDNELQAKLTSKNPADRMLAVMRLGESQTGARAAFLHLVESLKDQDFGVRTSAASALVRAGADAVPHLEKLLNDPHRLVRVNGARTKAQRPVWAGPSALPKAQLSNGRSMPHNYLLSRHHVLYLRVRNKVG